MVANTRFAQSYRVADTESESHGERTPVVSLHEKSEPKPYRFQRCYNIKVSEEEKIGEKFVLPFAVCISVCD